LSFVVLAVCIGVSFMMRVQLELREERTNSERHKKQSQILRTELDHLLQQLAMYVVCLAAHTYMD